MKMERLMIQIPAPLKQRLDALRTQGYTASSYIRALLERELHTAKPNHQKGKASMTMKERNQEAA